MPFYEYVCTECGNETTILQKVSDAPATECPKCHAAALIKQMSASGFRLKGAGWYETDFKSDNKKNLAGDSGDTKPAEKAESKGESKAGEKPAEKPIEKAVDKKPSADSAAKAETKPAKPAATPAPTTP